MHSLHNMFYSERKKVSWSIFTVFVCGYLSAAMFKCSILNDAGVLNPPEYAPTWIAYIFKCLTKDNNWSLWVQCMTIIFDFEDINQQICDRLVELDVSWTLAKKWGIHLNVVHTISNASILSLAKSFPVVH